jgi:predicted regulator of Ras-like GTPase activity (Roadblock/LC7/MglB family)
MNHGILDQQQLVDIEEALQQELIGNGVSCAILIDTAGNTIADKNDGKNTYDIYAFAALAAGNYATVDSMAKLVGEEDFSQLYHKGQQMSIHFSRMVDEYLLITVFDNDLALGFLRMQVAELRDKLGKICKIDDTN